MPPHGSLYINCSNNIRYHLFFSEITRPSKLTELNANLNILWGVSIEVINGTNFIFTYSVKGDNAEIDL